MRRPLFLQAVMSERRALERVKHHPALRTDHPELITPQTRIPAHINDAANAVLILITTVAESSALIGAPRSSKSPSRSQACRRES